MSAISIRPGGSPSAGRMSRGDIAGVPCVYITPEYGRNGKHGAAIAHCTGYRMQPNRHCRRQGSRPDRLALSRGGVHRDFGGFGKKSGIFAAEYGSAKADGGIDLRLPEWPIGIAGMAK
jgi:hypothetical protein